MCRCMRRLGAARTPADAARHVWLMLPGTVNSQLRTGADKGNPTV